MDYMAPDMELLDISVGDAEPEIIGPSGMPEWFPGVW